MELLLVAGLILLITAISLPPFVELIRREEMPTSAKQLRALLTLVQANAQFDGLRYRVRFAGEEEEDALGGNQQPMIEREDDPMNEPEVFNLVTEPWAVGATLLGKVRCAEIRLGKPQIEQLKRLREARRDTKDRFGREFEDYAEEWLPLTIEPDGTSDWATFVLTETPREVSLDDLENLPRLELIWEGASGLAWMQRPFHDEELDLFEEKGWPAVLRQDYLDPRVLTENDVLELRDIPVSQGTGGGGGEAAP